MESGNEVGEWFSSWWGGKFLFLGRPDDFRAPGWASRDQTCARREARRRNGIRAAREGWGGSLPMLAPVRSRCRQGCPQERTCPRSPRDLRPQAGNPGCSPARILGGEKGVLPMSSARIGNRSLPPVPVVARLHPEEMNGVDTQNPVVAIHVLDTFFGSRIGNNLDDPSRKMIRSTLVLTYDIQAGGFRDRAQASVTVESVRFIVGAFLLLV